MSNKVVAMPVIERGEANPPRGNALRSKKPAQPPLPESGSSGVCVRSINPQLKPDLAHVCISIGAHNHLSQRREQPNTADMGGLLHKDARKTSIVVRTLDHRTGGGGHFRAFSNQIESGQSNGFAQANLLFVMAGRERRPTERALACNPVGAETTAP